MVTALKEPISTPKYLLATCGLAVIGGVVLHTASHPMHYALGVGALGGGGYLIWDNLQPVLREAANACTQRSLANKHVVALAAGSLGVAFGQAAVVSGDIVTTAISIGACALSIWGIMTTKRDLSWTGVSDASGSIDLISPHHLSRHWVLSKKIGSDKGESITLYSLEAALFTALFSSEFVLKNANLFEGKNLKEIRNLYPKEQNEGGAVRYVFANPEFEINLKASEIKANWNANKRLARLALKELLFEKYGIGLSELSPSQQSFRTALTRIQAENLDYKPDTSDNFLIGSDDNESLVSSKTVAALLQQCRDLIRQGRTQEREHLEILQRELGRDSAKKTDASALKKRVKF